MRQSKVNTISLLFSFFFIFSTLLWPVNYHLLSTWHIRLNEIFYFFTAILLLGSDQKITIQTKKTFLILAPALLVHFFFTSYLFCKDFQQLAKGFVSILMFLIMIFSGMELGVRSKAKDWLNLEKASLLIITVTILFLLIEIVYPDNFPKQLNYRIGGLYSGIYDEPSHLAFSIFPSILFTLHSKQKSIFLFGIIASVILIFLSASSTLIIILIISTISVFYTRLSLPFFFVSTGIFLSSLTLYSIFYESNTLIQFQIKAHDIFSNEGSNLSSLVYIQGWYDAILNLKRTLGFGLGFNMMGCEPLPSHSIRSTINAMGFYGLNSSDGSFLLSKGLSELGIFFFIIIIITMFFCIRAVINLHNTYLTNRVYLIKCLMLIAFLITTLLRTSGYFCGTVACFVITITSLWRSEKNEKKSK